MGVILNDSAKPVYTGAELNPKMIHNAVQNQSFNPFKIFVI